MGTDATGLRRKALSSAAASADQVISAATNVLPALAAARLGEEGLTAYGIAATLFTITAAATHACIGERLLWRANQPAGTPCISSALSTAALIGIAAGVAGGGLAKALGQPMSLQLGCAVLLLGSALTVPLRTDALRDRRLVAMTASDLVWFCIAAGWMFTNQESPATPIWLWAIGGWACVAVLAATHPHPLRPRSPYFDRRHSGPLAVDFALSSLLVQATSLTLAAGAAPAKLGDLRSAQATVGPAASVRTALSNLFVSRSPGGRAHQGATTYVLSTIAIVWSLNLVVFCTLRFTPGLGPAVFSDSWGGIRQLLAPVLVVGSTSASATTVMAVLRRTGHTQTILRRRIQLAPLALGPPLVGVAVFGVLGLLGGRLLYHLAEWAVWHAELRRSNGTPREPTGRPPETGSYGDPV